jgi:hypothetical protein
MCEEVIQLV